MKIHPEITIILNFHYQFSFIFWPNQTGLALKCVIPIESKIMSIYSTFITSERGACVSAAGDHAQLFSRHHFADRLRGRQRGMAEVPAQMDLEGVRDHQDEV